MNPAVQTYEPSIDEIAEYEKRLASARQDEDKVLHVLADGREIAWYPQAGSQEAFLDCKLLECLYHGTRGPGKTDALLMSFAQYVDRGHGAAWRGIIFRQTYPQLADVQAKSEKWFRLIFGTRAKFNRAKMMWEWDTGEVLMFRHMNRPEDYWNYHGHEYPFIGWEELTNWADDRCYKSMFACCRTSTAGVPRMVRATTNPYGVGHNWVKDRWQLVGRWWETIIQLRPIDPSTEQAEPPRAAIFGHIDENKILLAADPEYKTTIIASASNPAMAKAWLAGSWDIVAGGMFGDVWRPKRHVLEPFILPRPWRLARSFDWGSSRPFSVGWWAESDGSDYKDAQGRWKSSVRGDLFRIAEWYGWNGRPNEGLTMLAVDVGRGIIQREHNWGWNGRVRPGPADTGIYDVENGVCIATDMARHVRLENGLSVPGPQFVRADKSPGSRKTGWEMMRKMFKNSQPPPEGGPRELAGLFIFNTCQQFIRTVPSLPRDELDPDDVDTDAEDHIGDETRYMCRWVGNRRAEGRSVGLY